MCLKEIELINIKPQTYFYKVLKLKNIILIILLIKFKKIINICKIVN